MFEYNVYHSLDSVDEYVWCYSEHMDWWTNNIPEGAVEAIVSAKNKIAKGQPLGFSETQFVEAQRRVNNYREDSIKNIVPRTAVIYKLGKAKDAPVIDGQLDEPLWSKIEPLEEFLVTKLYLKDKPDARTTAQVAWDDKNLYIAFTCYEPNIGSLRPTGIKRDDDIWRSDSVEAMISLSEKPHPYRQFMINPKNLVSDSTWYEGKKMGESPPLPSIHDQSQEPRVGRDLVRR
jgi:hypothetical protein